MSQLASEEEIALAVKHLMQLDNGFNTQVLKSLAKYLEINQQTTSEEFNKYLKIYIDYYQKPYEVGFSEQEKKALKLQRLLNEISNEPKIDLTYQGVNLGTAISMKLAVNLAALIQEENHVE